jgi:diguanylate cyclase (GGDEF)-like protein
MHSTMRRRCTVAVVAFVLAFAVVIQLEIAGARGTLILSNVVECLAPLLAAVGCWFASRRSSATRQRRAWRFMAASAASWGLGQLVWTYYTVSGVAAPYPSVADVGYLLAVPLALAGVWGLAGRSSRSQRMLAVVDGLITTGALLMISWLLVLGQAWCASANTPWRNVALSMAYPTGNLIVVSSVLLVVMRSGRGGPVPFLHIATGLFLLVFADSVFVLSTIQGSEANTSIADIGWTAGYLVIFLASLAYPLDRPDATRQHGTSSLRRALVPFTVLSIALAMRLEAVITGRRANGFTVAVTVVTTGLVLVRQILTMRENQELTRSLEQKIGELTTREGQLTHQAFHDPLTGLANRRLFSDRVDHALVRGRGSGEVTAVLFVDLDDFKTVNDSLGHAVGDQLLVAMGSRLSACVRPGDTVARLGGDEFGILLEEVDEPDLPVMVAERMLDALDRPFSLAGRQVFTRASIGFAIGDQITRLDGEELLADADVALYAAKGAGKAMVRRFEPVMRASALERLELGQDLRQAVDQDQFFCEYQPIVDLVSGRAVAVEALVRWNHPSRGLVFPKDFVDLAEDIGMIGRIGKRVLEIATTQCATWRESGAVPASMELHVNLSGRQLEEADLKDQVAVALSRSGFPAAQLILEITETVAVEVGAKHLDRLISLRDLGVRLAIDDFGTGYSSLNYLRALPVDVLKIDRAFAETLDGATDSVLLEAIVNLGHSLGIEMIAEGIEREEQAATLRRLGCRRAQGYLWHRPAPGADLPAIVAASRGRAPKPAAPEPAEPASAEPASGTDRRP